METLKHVGYWCGTPSEAFPEKRDHAKCDEHPFSVRKTSAGEVKVICTCPCRRGTARKAD